jgi:hypothetical protein
VIRRAKVMALSISPSFENHVTTCFRFQAEVSAETADSLIGDLWVTAKAE